MAIFNRDIEAQEQLAQELTTNASKLVGDIESLKSLLQAMKGNAVFDDNSTAAIDRIIDVVDKLAPAAELADEKSKRISEQAVIAKNAQSKLDAIE